MALCRFAMARDRQRAAPPRRHSSDGDAPGLLARRIAVAAVDGVLRHRRPLNETLDADQRLAALLARDRAFVQALARITCRRLGQIVVALDERLERGLPRRAGALEAILVCAVTQLLFLDVPDHAAVDLAVRLVREDPGAQPFAGLANAVLRAIARDKAIPVGPEANLPEWLGERWAAIYGADVTAKIAAAQLAEAPLDLTARGEPREIAAALGGTLLPTGTIRIAEPSGPIPALGGFAEGAWWVQDAAALLPVLALGEVKGKRILDLCAAPGGKTAALAARGAKVTAVERRPERMARLAQNLDRLRLSAELIVRDVLDLDLAPDFDAVLLDAPCTATGTIRRHPDVAWIKQPGDVAALAAIQERLIDKALGFVRPGGLLVYGTCSLEPEEGEQQVTRLLARRPNLEIRPIAAEEVGGLAELVTAEGFLRSRPDLLASHGGIDGFFVARLAVPLH